MRVLQLGKHGGRANQQQHQPHRRGRQSLGGLAHAGQQALHRACALLAHEVLQLGLDLTSGGVFTRHQPGDRHHDQQQRRQWKQGVKGQRCAHARHIVVQPGSRRLFDQAPACCKQVGVCHGVQMCQLLRRAMGQPCIDVNSLSRMLLAVRLVTQRPRRFRRPITSIALAKLRLAA